MRDALFSAIASNDFAGAKEIVDCVGRPAHFWRNRNGMTPIMSAALYGRKSFIKFLHDAGADVDDINHAGHNALLIAIMHGDLPSIGYLAAHTANIDHQNKEGRSALHSAIHNSNFEAVRLLLSHGANPELKNGRGEDAVALSRGKCREIADLILSFIRDKKENQSLNDLIDTDHEPIDDLLFLI